MILKSQFQSIFFFSFFLFWLCCLIFIYNFCIFEFSSFFLILIKNYFSFYIPTPVLPPLPPLLLPLHLPIYSSQKLKPYFRSQQGLAYQEQAPTLSPLIKAQQGIPLQGMDSKTLVHTSQIDPGVTDSVPHVNISHKMVIQSGKQN